MQLQSKVNSNNKKKIFNDPVYGFISIPQEIIFDVIEHPFMQRLRAQKTSLPDLLAELKDLAPDLVQALPNLPRNLLLAPGRIDLITASQKRQSQKLTSVQRALEQQSQRQTRQFGILLLSLAAIGLLINPSLGGDVTSGLSVTSIIIGGVGLQQILKGKG